MKTIKKFITSVSRRLTKNKAVVLHTVLLLLIAADLAKINVDLNAIHKESKRTQEALQSMRSSTVAIANQLGIEMVLVRDQFNAAIESILSLFSGPET